MGIPHGLKNFGSSCYINSVLQAFNALDPITDYLLTLNNPYTPIIEKNPPAAGLGYHYVNFLKEYSMLPPTPQYTAYAANTLDYVDFVHRFKSQVLESPKNEGHLTIQKSPFFFTKNDKDYLANLNDFYITTLASFLYRILYQTTDPLPKEIRDLLSLCPQEDVPFFIERLINALIEQDMYCAFSNTSEALKSHPFGKLIRIEITKKRQCNNYTNTKIEQESRLNLHIVHAKTTFTTLQACIDNLLSEHMVEYKPFGFDEIQLCTEKPQLTHLSDILIIALNRFSWKTSAGIKYKHTIKIPLTYDFAQHLPENYPGPTHYELIAAIEHLGEYNAGHYIAYIRQKNQWYICNDEHVFAVGTKDIEDYSNKWGAGAKERRGINYAYVYFYQKIAPVQTKIPVSVELPSRQQNKKQLLLNLQTFIHQFKILETSLKV